MNHLFYGLLLAVLLQVDLQGQNRWVVGPGGFSTVEAAYQLASPGDIILLRAPTIPVFALSGKGVRIIGDGLTPQFNTGRASIQNIPFGQEMYVENIAIDGWLRVANCNGSIILNHVSASCSQDSELLTGLYATGVASLICVDSYFRGCVRTLPPCIGMQTGAGFYCDTSMVSMHRSTIEEGPTGVFPCGAHPYPNQYFFSRVIAVLAGGFPGPYHANMTECILVGTATEPLLFHIVNASVSQLPWGTRANLTHATIDDYGTGLVTFGSGTVISHPRPLASLRAAMGQALTLNGSNAEANQPVFIGASINAQVQPFEPSGHQGTLVLDLTLGRSALFDVALSDSQGSWAKSYTVPVAIAQALEYQHFILQSFTIASTGSVHCSTWDIIRF